MSHGGTEEKIWTSRQFANAMRRAGWENKGQGCYVHSRTERKYMAWDWHPDVGEDWHRWAAVRQTPPPF